MVDAIVKLRQTNGVTQALVLNAIQREQFGRIKLVDMARTIRDSKPPTNIDVTAILSRPLAEIFQRVCQQVKRSL